MKPPDRSSDARAYGGDVAAYALGALEPAETKAFEAHLETCAVCRDKLAAFQTVVDVLPMSAPQHAAPWRLRRRVMSTVRGEARAQGDERRRPISLRHPAVAPAAVLAVIAVTVAALTLTGGQHTRVYTAQVVGSRGTAEVTVTGNQAQLIVRHFPPPPAGKDLRGLVLPPRPSADPFRRPVQRPGQRQQQRRAAEPSARRAPRAGHAGAGGRDPRPDPRADHHSRAQLTHRRSADPPALR